jgi:hypothetical protein
MSLTRKRQGRRVYVRQACSERPTGWFSFSRIGRDSVNRIFWKGIGVFQKSSFGPISCGFSPYEADVAPGREEQIQPTADALSQQATQKRPDNTP